MYRTILLVICFSVLSGCAHRQKVSTTAETMWQPVTEMDSTHCTIIDTVYDGMMPHTPFSEKWCAEAPQGEAAVMIYGGTWQVLEGENWQGYAAGIKDFLVIHGDVEVRLEMDKRQRDKRYWRVLFR